MYKIFINNIPLILTDSLTSPVILETLKNYPENTLLLNWDDIPEMILYAIEVLEKNNDMDYIIVFGDDLEKLKNAFWSFYEYKAAAGGVVRNEQQETLMIYRNEKWDLPKGKLNAGEKQEAAAIREVMEETGLNKLMIKQSLLSTYHTYKTDHKRILKETAWYLMEAAPPCHLKLQAEEGITDARWLKKEEIASYVKNSYKSIAEVMSVIV